MDKRIWAVVFTICMLAGLASPAHAAFQGNDVPTAVTTLNCGANPRIVVEFTDASKNVWYPANNGDWSKQFLTYALAAKAGASPLFYYGAGAATDLTSYCLSTTAREIYIFGIR